MEVFDSEFFAGLDRLALVLKRKPRMGMNGGRKSSAKGSSVEFSDFREYLLGDDPRYIDWNVCGRLDRLFVKLFMEEKEGIFHILLDASASMGCGKERRARQLTAMLAYIALRNLDRVYVSFLHPDGKTWTSRGMTGSRSFEELLFQLEKMEFYGETRLYESVRQLRLHGQGMTILISDFFDYSDQEALFRFLIYKKQEIVLLHLLSEEERNPSFLGSSNLIDEETREELRLTMSLQTRQEYKKSLEDMERELGRRAIRYQAAYVPCTAEQKPEQIILKLLRGEKQTGRKGGSKR